jgi:hypothetical protein
LVLLYAVLIGLLAGLIRAWINQSPPRAPELQWLGLLIIAFMAQAAAFVFPYTRSRIPDWSASVLLVASQVLLLIFVWLNRRQPGFWVLGLGLLLNFAVIVLNGGWMPISVETVKILAPNASPGNLIIGTRVGFSKDILLSPATIRIPWLADRFILSTLPGSRVAFSIGDVVISLGAVWLLWSIGDRQRATLQIS